jgi:hypothetical protein
MGTVPSAVCEGTRRPPEGGAVTVLAGVREWVGARVLEAGVHGKGRLTGFGAGGLDGLAPGPERSSRRS